MEKITPLSSSEFIDKIKINGLVHNINLYEYFKEYIDMAPHFAIGPFFWFIPDNSKMKISNVSENISSLTPYNSEHWKNQGPDFFASLIHKHDRDYVLSSIQIAIQTAQNLKQNERGLVKINIYGRLLNAENKYRWTLIQIPSFCLNENNLVLSGLILVTDMTHLNFLNSPMMTIIQYGNKQKLYFKVTNAQAKLLNSTLPVISKREKDVLHLMAKGLNSPQIAEALFISYHTVENHKRNLRKKTDTKTSAHLIDYVWRNNLM